MTPIDAKWRAYVEALRIELIRAGRDPKQALVANRDELTIRIDTPPNHYARQLSELDLVEADATWLAQQVIRDWREVTG